MFKHVLMTRGAALALPLLLAGCEKVKTLVEETSERATPSAASSAASALPGQVPEIDPANYADFIARPDALVVVDFHADWCGPCRRLAPVLEKAAAAHPGVVYVGKVNVDHARELAAAQKVRSIPDVRIFKGGREVDRFVGFPGERQVLAKISKLASGIKPPETPAAEPATEPDAQPAAEQPVLAPMTKDWLPPGLERR